MVRAWWPAIVLSHLPPKPNYNLLRSGVGGLLLSYHLLWSGVGGQLLFYHICHQNQISQSKTIVSREASSKFHRPSFQNERFVRGVLENFTEQASKTSVSCEASSKFHRPSFQNERFVRGLLEISQTKLPKRTFRARPPRNFTDQASKTSVSSEASSKFHRTKLPKRTFRVMLPTISIKKMRFATVSCHRPTESYERVHPAKAKYASRYNGVPSKISKCTFYYIQPPKLYESSARRPRQPAAYKNLHFQSFGHLTSTK